MVISKLQELLRLERIDPAPRRLARAARVSLKLGLPGEIAWSRLPQATRVLLARGLSTKTVPALHAINHPERLALVDDHRELTYAQFDAEINRLANGLRAAFGVERRTPVILMMENRSEYIVAWLALFRLGAVAVHASFRATPEELAYQVEHAGAQVIVASPTSWPAVRAFREAHPERRLQVVFAGEPVPDAPDVVAYPQLVTRGAPTYPEMTRTTDDEAANIVYTSGTTGKPKGAVRDFAAVKPRDFFRLMERLPMHAADRHLLVAPLYHSAGQAFSLMQIVLGSTIYIRPHFDPADTLERLSTERIHTIFMVPTMIRRVLDLPEELHRKWPTPELRGIISGAAAFPDALRRRAIERFGAEVIHDFYGATELGWVTLINGVEMLRKPGSVGRPLPGQEVRIMDRDGTPKPPGEVGLIYVRNEQTMVGYWNDPKATAETRWRDWLTVEDLGYLDEEGYLYLAGRARDMVISGGVNIYPVEIEEVLARHPDVKEVAVVGVPDPDWGERLVACVVPTGERFDPAELERYAREHLAGYKVPKEWHRYDALPRNPTGKVLKKRLRAELAAAQPTG